MRRAAFVVSKHPYGRVQDGETTITRLLLDAASESCSVGAVALSDERGVDAPYEVTEVPKPPLSIARLAARSVVRRRSLIHLRFSPEHLQRALADVEADVLVARRTYMAQPAIDAGRVPPEIGLAVVVDVLESMVMRERRTPLAPLLAVEARRTSRDEIACVEAAGSVAYVSDVEQAALSSVRPGPRLDLILPPMSGPSSLDAPTAAFIGDRTWAPNAEALEMLLRVWPEIAATVPGARLLLVGKPAARERGTPAGVERLGYVEDLEEIWKEAGVLLAPIGIGGGVRVKILDAARHGIPVVGTPAAVGSTSYYLPLGGHETEAQFAAEATRLLADRAARRAAGTALYERNRELWRDGFVARQVSDLIAAAANGASGPAAQPESRG
jgi:polysaccharide biosynthesis protein PslH